MSLAGEGRGHAVRAMTLVERLIAQNEIVLFSSGEAYEFLEASCHRWTPHVETRSIPGIRFHYSGNKLDLTKSILTGLRYAWNDLRPTVRELTRQVEAEQPDLIITDFEPCLPRAAQAAGLPFISLDHQHFLTTYDLSILPLHLRRYAWLMGFAVRLYHSGAAKTIVSSFFTPPLRPGSEDVTQIGPLIREEVTRRIPSDEGFIVSYLRKHTPASVVEYLAGCGKPVRIYGLGEQERRGSLSFLPISEANFLDDLAACSAVISAAGNQLLGESLFLGKPFFAMPERDHHEQMINAHFLSAMGCGDWRRLEFVDAAAICGFIQNLDPYRPGLKQTCGRLNGTEQAIQVIQDQLLHSCGRERIASTAQA